MVLHGANLDLLGERPAVHYGTVTLAELEEAGSRRRPAASAGTASACRPTTKAGTSSICTSIGAPTR